MNIGKPHGWGFIGASDIARNAMIPAIRAQPHNFVKAVMSSNLERAKQYASETDIPVAYDSVAALLADPDIDIVYISTTNELHHSQTLAAAKAGKHVLCEKPLTMSIEAATEMVKACRDAGVVMGTNHHLRNAGAHRTMRRMIAEGKIGQPLAARVFHAVYLPPRLQGWRLHKPEAGGGVILDITVHDTDTLRFVLNDDVESVTAFSSQQGLASGAVEDTVMGVMRFRSGLLAQFHDAFTIKHAGTGFQVHGTEASLFAAGVMKPNPPGKVFLQHEDKMEEVDTGEHEDVYVVGVRNFVQAVEGHGSPSATGEDGLHSLAVALAARESARMGASVRVRYQ
ncbi:MAG: Gfo/Idh/MocA family oxidoreductase [Chloroflexi bacterium]|uniref:Gfo/Idh/MocA family oxidoreductase n=1 Tax=Candidatus Chlorohelix allophototropha TaxID=3003348 RepID=A0A8T7LXY2_9CHLR|nr:Gfo/Idh/MocA family oxidoreductase [Chloroflexota bacterium]WJW67626.1 Gfo/Idh/MocA family oxidoreductase [Chloroflexota bacterium L227-S17]